MDKVSRCKIIRFLIYFNFLFPTFNSIFSDVDFAMGPVIIHFFITMVCLFCMLFARILGNVIITISILFFLFFLSIILLTTLFTPNEIILRDLFELHRPFYYGSVFILPLTFKWDKDSLYKFVIKPIIICFIFQILFGLLTLPSLNIINYLREFYTKPKNIHSERATGTFITAYDYGYMLCFIVIYYFSLFLNEKSQKTKYKYLFLLLSAIMAILISQSRTAAILLICSITYFAVMYFFLNFTSKKRNKIIKILATVLTVYFIFGRKFLTVIEKNFHYLYGGLRVFFNEGAEELGSTRIRLSQLEWAWTEVQKRPFGYGPGKGVSEYLEMQYSLYLYRYGFIGLLIVVFYFLYSFIISYRTLIFTKRVNDLKTEAFFSGFHVWCAMLPIASFGNAFIDMTRISFFFFLLNGICTSIYFYQKK